jgi:hypothetical protein
MTFTPLIHEQALVSAIPLFGVVLLRKVRFWRAVAAIAPPALVGVTILDVAPSSPGAVAHLIEKMSGHASFMFRYDALALFERTQAASWTLYNTKDVSVVVEPYVIRGVIARSSTSRRCEPLPRRRHDNRRRPATEETMRPLRCLTFAALVAGCGWPSTRVEPTDQYRAGGHPTVSAAPAYTAGPEYRLTYSPDGSTLFVCADGSTRSGAHVEPGAQPAC